MATRRNAATTLTLGGSIPTAMPPQTAADRIAIQANSASARLSRIVLDAFANREADILIGLVGEAIERREELEPQPEPVAPVRRVGRPQAAKPPDWRSTDEQAGAKAQADLKALLGQLLAKL